MFLDSFCTEEQNCMIRRRCCSTQRAHASTRHRTTSPHPQCTTSPAERKRESHPYFDVVVNVITFLAHRNEIIPSNNYAHAQAVDTRCFFRPAPGYKAIYNITKRAISACSVIKILKRKKVFLKSYFILDLTHSSKHYVKF